MLGDPLTEESDSTFDESIKESGALDLTKIATFTEKCFTLFFKTSLIGLDLID
jgi:hypothetical protein